MNHDIDIREFKGVFTNADPEDLPDFMLTALENMRPVNGMLEKTFGIGSRAGVIVLPETVTNLFTHIHPEHDDGYKLMALAVDAATKALTIYSYDDLDWVILSPTSGPYYHRSGARNPVIIDDGILRLLPGNVGYAIGAHEGKGVWIGYIDRSRFDCDDTYTGFWACDTEILKPSLTWSVTEHDFEDSGFTAGNSFYYLFSAVYDGIQESLLSDNPLKWVPSAAHKFPQITSQMFSSSDINRRITGFKVYRREYNASTGVMGNYEHIHTVDFLRPAADVTSGATGFYRYDNMVAIPALESEMFGAGDTYTVEIDGGGYEAIDTPGDGTGYFHFHYTSFTVLTPKWNVSWSIKKNGAAWKSGTSGGYCSHNGLAVVGTSLFEDTYSRGVLIAGTGAAQEYTGIDTNSGKVLYLKGVIGTHSNAAWTVLSPSKGIYVVTPYGDDYWISFYDAGLDGGEEHPLAGEKYIKVNGAFARVISGRLWQANVVLDPGGKNEAHTDWATYSETDQYDVNPVSNAIRCADREGGPITGLAEIFGNPVVLKKQAILAIHAKNQTPPFVMLETAHAIGNIATEGYIEAAGDLYVCWIDGIYRLRPNNLAETDQTPTDRLKITGPIEDVYLALTQAQKEAIKVLYDPLRSEIVWQLGYDKWAFNVKTELFREITSTTVITVAAKDNDGFPLIYNDATKDVYGMGPLDKESVGIRLRTKVYELDCERTRMVRQVWVIYTSPAALTLNIYADGATAASKTMTLPINTSGETIELRPKAWAKKIQVEITGGYGTSTVKINRISVDID